MPPPTKEYIANVYGALADAYKDFDKTPQEFEALISSDADYRSRVYGALKDGYADFDKTPEQFDIATIGGVVPEPPKGDIASQLLGKMDNKPSRGDMASLPGQPDLRIERLREALPAMKEKKVKDITANNLLSKGVVTPEGSKAYNEERTQVQANLKDEEWMPSHFLKNTEAVKQKAIETFAFNSKETPDVVKQKIAKGEYMFDEGKVKVTGGFGDNFVQSLKDLMGTMKIALDIEGAKANRNTDAEAADDIKNILIEANRKRSFEQEVGANTIAGHAGKTAGGIAPYMLPYADIPLMGISNMGANYQEIWADPTMSDDQKVMAINQSAKDAFMIGAAQGAAFRAMHAGEPPVTAASLLSKYAPTSELKQKFATSLYNNYRAILSAIPKDVAKVALVGAGTEVANTINRASVGAKVDFSKVPESALDLAALDLLMKAPKVLTSAFASIKEARRSGIDKIDPKWYNAYHKQTQDALNAIVSAPEAIYQQALSHIADSPDVNAQSAKLKIETFRGYYNSLPADLPEAAKAKALHILQLKTEAIDDMTKSSEPAIRKVYEDRAAAYDGLLQKLVADKDIDTKKEPLLIDRFAKPAPPPEPPAEATEPIAPEPVKPAPKPQKPVVVAAPAKPQKEGYSAGTLADFNGKDVRYNGEPATLAIDEGGKVTAETRDRIYEIPDAKPEDRIEQHGMQEPKHVVSAVTNDAATVNDVKYNIHTDEKGNVVAVSPFNNPKQQITNEPLIKAVEIARNRQDVKEIHATIDENADHAERTIIDSGISNQTTVNALLGINMNETVDRAMTKLESGEKLTDQEALQLEVWGYDAIERLSKHDDAATKDTQEGILNILDELHQTHNNEQRASTETNSPNAAESKGAGLETKVAGSTETKTETQTIKADAIPEPSTAPVLQRQPEETGVAGSERRRVEPIVEGAAPATEGAPRQEGGTGDGKTPKVKKPRVFKPSTRQDKVNSLIEATTKHNYDMRKGTPKRRAAANEIKLKATELGLTWNQDRTSGRLEIVTKDGNPVQRRFAGTGSEEPFDKTNYDPQTHELVKAHFENKGGLLGLAIQGDDGNFFTEDQKIAALQDLRDGKDTKRAKAVYDSFQSMVDRERVAFRDNETGEVTPIPVAEYLAEIKKEKPLTDTQIEENYPSLWDDGQEDLFSETQQPAGTTADEGAPKTGTEADHKEADGEVPNRRPVTSEVEVNLFNETAGSIAEKKKGLSSKIQDAIARGNKKWGSKKEELGYYDGSQSEKMIDVPNFSFSDERGREYIDGKRNPKFDPAYHKDLWELDALKHDMDDLNEVQQLHQEDYTYTDNRKLKNRLGSLVFSFGGSDAKKVRDAFEANKIMEHLRSEGETVDVDKIITEYKDADASEGQIQKFKNNAAEITAIVENKGVGVAEELPKRITNKAEAKKVADKWRDIANNIENFKFGDGAMLDVTALPRYIIGKAIKGAAEIIEASGSIADAVAHVAQKLREYYDEKDISYKASETKKAATDILKTVGLIPGAPPRVTKSAINETVETGKIKGDKVTMSQREALKKQIKDFARGFLEGAKKGKAEGIDIGLDAGIKAGVKAGVKRGVHIEKDAQRDFYEGISKFLKDAHFNGKLTESQAKALARKAAKVGTNTNRLVDFIEYASKVIDDIHYAQKEADAKQLQKQIGKYVRSSKTFTNNVDILRALKRIPIGKLSPEHLDEFLRIAKEYRDAQLSPTNENYQPFNTTKNAIALEKIQKQLQIDADNQLINKAEELSGVLFLSADEAKVMLEALAADDVDKYAENLSDAKQKQLSAALLQRAEYSQMAVRQSLVDSDYIDQVHPRAAAMMERIAKADLTGLSDKKLVETIKALDNALLNGVPANLGRIDAMVQVHQNIPLLEKVTSANKKFSLNRYQEALEDLPVLMKAIYGLSGTVAEVRRLTGFDQVFNGGSIAKKAFLDKFKEYDKFLKENNISKKPDDVLRRGMYGHAIQHEGGTPEEINARFANNKRLIEQSIEAYGKRDSTKDLAVRLQAIYDADFKKFDSLDDLMTHFAANRVEDVKAQQFFEKAFEGMKDDIQYVTEAYHNELFEGNTVNYTPRGYNFVDRELNHQPGEPAMRFNNYVGKPPQSATSIKRVVEKNLPTGMALDFNFDYQMLKQFKKAQYDIQTTAGQFVFSEFMKRGESDDILGGGDNKDRFKNQYIKAEAIQGGQSAENDLASDIFKDVTSTLKNLSTTAALGSFTAYAKQYPSVAIKTLGTLGSDAGLFFAVQKIDMKDLPLLAQTSIVMRGESQGGTNTGNKDDVLRNQQISESVARNSLRWVSEKTSAVRNIMMKSLEEGDVRVAKRSFLAYYMKYLKDNGVSIKPEDLYTEHERLDEVRQKALSYAQQMVDESQVVSNTALMSDFKRPDRNFYKDLVTTVILPFNTFASNTRARMIEDGKFVFSGDKQQRKEALRDIGTSIAEIVAYQAINAFVIQAGVKYVLHEILEKVFGVEDSDPKTYNDRLLLAWKMFYSNVLKDTLVSGFGGLIENGTLQSINQLGWYLHKTNNPDEQMPKHEWLVKNAPLFVYEKISPSMLDQFGAYGIFLSQLGNIPNDLRAALTGTGKAENSYMNEAEVPGQDISQPTTLRKDVQLNANEQRFMMWQSLLDIAAIGGFSDAEIKRITEAKKREILMNAGRKTKTSKTLYRELRHGK